MIRRFWDSREGGLVKATVAICGGLAISAFVIVGIAVSFGLIYEVIR